MKKSGGIRKKIRMGVKQKILIPVMIVSLVVCVGLGVVLGSRMANVIRDLAAQQALAEETAATCEQLSAQTQSMDMLMKRFKVEQRSVYGGF